MPANSAAPPLDSSIRHIERRQWWLFSSGVIVTLLLTLGIVSVRSACSRSENCAESLIDTELAVRALVGLVLLFDIYVIFQQLQIHRFRKRLVEREELFRLISENAADMIAVVDVDGKRLYNSPSYQTLLGYSNEELQQTSGYTPQIHPDDQKLVVARPRPKRGGREWGGV